MKAVRFTITAELLSNMLRLPEGTDIVRIRMDTEHAFENCSGIEIVVRNDSLPNLGEGGHIPVVNPQYRTVDGVAEFVSWNRE
jgi:hypothetical protein